MSDKTRKYILYAIGEVLLVVIGILIALQVNNWREQVHKNERELETVRLLIRDLKGDHEAMSYFVNRLVRQNSSTVRFIEGVEKNLPDSILAHTYPTLNIWNYRPTYPTFEGLKQNGNLDLIADPEIRDLVVYYHDETVSYLDDLRDRYKSAVLGAQESAEPYLIRSWSPEDSVWIRDTIVDFENMRRDRNLLSKVSLAGSRRTFLSTRLRTLFIPDNEELTNRLINYEKKLVE